MPARRQIAAGDSADSGFTLIELLIYMVLSVVVLLIVGGLLINSLNAERTVRDATQASTAGQLISKSLGQGVRNASAIWHTPAGVQPELLIVRTAGAGATASWYCQAWSYANGEVRTKTSTTLISTIPASVASWTLLGAGIAPVSGAPVFPKSGRQVDLTLDVKSGQGKAVRISTTLTSRQPVPVSGVEVSAPCF
ncbi:prepilin-type N-terminal cleavage/methylation domain-containing protein [Cryobacterium sp. Sr8]|uniref:prepilin-type N-terminal cleavage/methylation domain-containing protein n=1 Tax=Cryobacterium sp. Sr8 TaxID=1259203 RepID=UPI00141BC767|nr:prepilin-type N-terminal cleavage/methylation domain-containing protein [Cryobacterium sp. Sr8]